MKYFYILLKSHTSAPDYEDEGYFKSKEEAVNVFSGRLPGEWDIEEIKNCVYELDIPNLDREEDM